MYLPLLCTPSKQANTCRFVTESKPDSCTHFSPSSNFLPIHPSSYKQHFLSLPPLSPAWKLCSALTGGRRREEGGRQEKEPSRSFSRSRPLGTQIKKQHQKEAEMKAAKKVERCQTSEPRFAYSDFPIDRRRHRIISRPSRG